MVSRYPGDAAEDRQINAICVYARMVNAISTMAFKGERMNVKLVKETLAAGAAVAGTAVAAVGPVI